MAEAHVRYEHLGEFGQGRPMYKEGDRLVHPSGAVYQRINGNWVCIEQPKD